VQEDIWQLCAVRPGVPSSNGWEEEAKGTKVTLLQQVECVSTGDVHGTGIVAEGGDKVL